ncbi:MAG: hypothetical protein ABSC13_09220 [Dehalococcoidia bacterium]
MRWQPVQSVALRKVELLAAILVSLRSVAKGEGPKFHPMLTINATLLDMIIPGDLRGFNKEVHDNVHDIEWPKIMAQTARSILNDLLRYPILITSLRRIIIDLESLTLAAGRWQEYEAYLSENGFPEVLRDGEAYLFMDAILAVDRSLDLAASCVEEARRLRGIDSRDLESVSLERVLAGMRQYESAHFGESSDNAANEPNAE